MTRNVLLIDWGRRAEKLLKELSTYTEKGPGVTRLPFSPEHKQALALLQKVMLNAGLSVSLDNAGTLIGRLEGPPDSKTFMMGSHQDSVRQGGGYDGIMGVILPIMALEKLKEESYKLPFSVEILAFADEEGVRFPTALIGSRALAGTYDSSVLSMVDSDGISLKQALTQFGLRPDQISHIKRSPNDIIGFLETHIEQGPILEESDEAVGVVTAICGIERHQIVIKGETGHAGTLPMSGRRDALVGAASIITEVNRMGQEETDLRSTVGSLSLEPNVVNAVPREVRMTAEFRSPNDDKRQSAGEHLHDFAKKIAAGTGLNISCSLTYEQMAQPCDKTMSVILEKSILSFGGRAISLPSGATHDASAIADLCPISMLFVRCRDGVSHKPEEFASSDDMGMAISVLATFLKQVQNLS
ncbi:allantoate amidohydrolase [Kiloniella litopenaei]|uniref:Allantoate amidohydrolase n=1 Tax=Kiloniella litopenaei TaxID=1549748 RepID=A0A0M2R4J7_9PROT|nr:M20 family metallo-hydrolase [Kiloniella litopenaei]KKJ75364.1 allantoate amidohydrolase [Kiloniella litopenaei]